MISKKSHRPFFELSRASRPIGAAERTSVSGHRTGRAGYRLPSLEVQEEMGSVSSSRSLLMRARWRALDDDVCRPGSEMGSLTCAGDAPEWLARLARFLAEFFQKS